MNTIPHPGSLLLAVAANLLILAGCKTQAPESAALQMDTAVYADSTATHICRVSIEYPANANDHLKQNFGEYVSESLGDAYAGSVLQPDSMALYYGTTMKDSLESMSKELRSLGSTAFQLSSDVKFTKVYETPQLVSFERDAYSFSGGAHGSHSVTGITFRKSDGRRFGTDMLINTAEGAFAELIKNGLKGYFSRNGQKVATDDDLNNCLLGVHAYDLPLPQFPPYLTQKGVTFVYQQYEIAPYAAGIPTFTIPYDKIKPYLSRAVRNALELH